MSIVRSSFVYRRWFSTTVRSAQWFKPSQGALISPSTATMTLMPTTAINKDTNDARLKESNYYASNRRQSNLLSHHRLRVICSRRLVNYTKRNFFCTAPTHTEALIDVLDESGIRTGEVLSREKIHELGKVHRAVHLYLFDKSGRILLQRRSANKDPYPGMLCLSVTGHVDAGESSSVALYREIQEELRIDPADMKIQFLFSFREDTTISATSINRQFNDVYACIHDFQVEDIDFDCDEIGQLQLIPFEKVREMMVADKSEIVASHIRECADVAYFFRSSLQECS